MRTKEQLRKNNEKLRCTAEKLRNAKATHRKYYIKEIPRAHK